MGFKMIKDDFLMYVWLICISFFSSIFGLIGKEKLSNCQNKKCKVFKFVSGVGTSMIVAYFAFEVSFYYLNHQKLSIALAGVAAWMGADALVSLQEILVKFINRKIES